MKFSIDRNTLLTALQRIGLAVMTYKEVNQRGWGRYGLFRCFIFKADQDELHITASDSRVILEETISIGNPHAEKATFAIDAGPFLKAVKTLDGQSVEIDVLEYQVIVRHATGSFAMPLNQEAIEFDSLYRISVNYETAHYLILEAPGIKSILDRCAYAVAQDELRPIMNGVCLNLTNDHADFVASDGHKLIRVRKPSIKTENPAMMIMPKHVITILRKITPKTGFVEIWFNEYIVNWPEDDRKNCPQAACRIVVDGITITFRPIEGRYPNYDSVIPQNFNTDFTINRLALIKSVERLSLFANDTSGLITLVLDSDTLEMTAADKDFELSADEKIPCSYSGSRFRFGLKDYSLLQTLWTMKTTDVCFKLIDQSRAIIISPLIQPESEEITALLMPMLIND